MPATGDNSNILQALEACRPDSDDLQLPEMADLARAVAEDAEIERRYLDVQRSDAALNAAFHDVPAPDGLQERLLAALASQDVQAEIPPAKADTAPSPAGNVMPRQSPSDSRRLFVGGAIAASLAIAVGLGALVWSWRTPVDASTWASAAVDLRSGLPNDPNAWNSSASAPENRPAFHQWQRGVVGGGWHPVKCDFDRRAVAYRFTQRGTTATLLVFRPRSVDAQLPLAPPAQPTQATSLVTTGVWTSDGLVYALVVDGGVSQYQSFIRTSIAVWSESPTSLSLAVR